MNVSLSSIEQKETPVTVLMSVYNEEPIVLRKAIDSVLLQTFQNFEFLIIIDNPKRNDLISIVQDYSTMDHRIRYLINERNLGLPLSLNRGICETSSKFIARMDADDICEPTRLEKQFYIMQQDESITLLSSNCRIIDDDDNVIYEPHEFPTNPDDIKKIMGILDIIAHPSVMYRRNDVEEVGLYRNINSCEDYDLWLRMLDADKKLCITNERLFRYRKRANSISSKSLYKQYLTAEYVKKLHSQRIKKGTDTFSVSNLEDYLQKKRCYDAEYSQRFIKGFLNKEEIMPNLKKKKYIEALRCFFIAFFSSKLSRIILIENIESNLLKKWFRIRG